MENEKKWIVEGELIAFATCPDCGFSIDIDELQYIASPKIFNYCPICGVRLLNDDSRFYWMNGGQDERS